MYAQFRALWHVFHFNKAPSCPDVEVNPESRDFPCRPCVLLGDWFLGYWVWGYSVGDLGCHRPVLRLAGCTRQHTPMPWVHGSLVWALCALVAAPFG